MFVSILFKLQSMYMIRTVYRSWYELPSMSTRYQKPAFWGIDFFNRNIVFTCWGSTGHIVTKYMEQLTNRAGLCKHHIVSVLAFVGPVVDPNLYKSIRLYGCFIALQLETTYLSFALHYNLNWLGCGALSDWLHKHRVTSLAILMIAIVDLTFLQSAIRMSSCNICVRTSQLLFAMGCLLKLNWWH